MHCIGVIDANTIPVSSFPTELFLSEFECLGERESKQDTKKKKTVRRGSKCHVKLEAVQLFLKFRFLINLGAICVD